MQLSKLLTVITVNTLCKMLTKYLWNAKMLTPLFQARRSVARYRMNVSKRIMFTETMDSCLDSDCLYCEKNMPIVLVSLAACQQMKNL